MNDMADASPESIQRLIENSEKGLSQIETSLPLVLDARAAVVEAIGNKGGNDVVLDLLLVVLDTVLAENEVIYDLSTSLDALLRADNDYAKRFYMQSLNLCFWESCQVFVGESDNDQYGLLSRLEGLTKQLNQAGCQFISRHIMDDIQAFRSDYTDKELRNITRHYDDPIKMYERICGLNNIDFFAKGSSQLMAIRMEVTVVSSFLLSLLVPAKNGERPGITKRKQFDIKGIINDAIFKSLKEKNLKKELQDILAKGQSVLDECYRLHQSLVKATDYLKEHGCSIPEGFRKMESIILLRMDVLYMKHDIACAVWGYLNAASDNERSQNLRLIHITKQAALTHIYGYNDNIRKRSLWSRIKAIEEAGNIELKTEGVEKSLEELVSNLSDDNKNSRMYAHYRYKQEFYIPARLDAFGKMVHYKELTDAVKLLNVCKTLEGYTCRLLSCIDEKQKQETKKKHDEWIEIIDGLAAKMGNNENSQKVLEPLKNLVDMVYGGIRK